MLDSYPNRLKMAWLKVVTLESCDKALDLFCNAESFDDKSVLLGAADEVCFSNVHGGNF